MKTLNGINHVQNTPVTTILLTKHFWDTATVPLSHFSWKTLSNRRNSTTPSGIGAKGCPPTISPCSCWTHQKGLEHLCQGISCLIRDPGTKKGHWTSHQSIFFLRKKCSRVLRSSLGFRKQENWNEVVVAIQPLVSLLCKFHYKLREEQQQNLPHTFWSTRAQSCSTTAQGLLSETAQGTYQ